MGGEGWDGRVDRVCVCSCFCVTIHPVVHLLDGTPAFALRSARKRDSVVPCRLCVSGGRVDGEGRPTPDEQKACALRPSSCNLQSNYPNDYRVPHPPAPSAVGAPRVLHCGGAPRRWCLGARAEDHNGADRERGRLRGRGRCRARAQGRARRGRRAHRCGGHRGRGGSGGGEQRRRHGRRPRIGRRRAVARFGRWQRRAHVLLVRPCCSSFRPPGSSSNGSSNSDDNGSSNCDNGNGSDTCSSTSNANGNGNGNSTRASNSNSNSNSNGRSNSRSNGSTMHHAGVQVLRQHGPLRQGGRLPLRPRRLGRPAPRLGARARGAAAGRRGRGLEGRRR